MVFAPNSFLGRIRCGGLLVLCLLTGSGLRGGPIEDAAKLVADKQYDQVDKVLEGELAKRQPELEALRLSLIAAEALGHYTTANQRIAALMLKGETQDPALVLRAARIAANMGNTQLALSRYFQYSDLQKAKSPELEESLRYLIQYGTYPEQYIRYLSLYGPAGAWRPGVTLLEQLIQAADAENALKIAKVLMDTYKENGQIGRVHELLRYAADNFLLGRDNERYLPALRVMLTDQYSYFGHIGHVFRSSEGLLGVSERVDMLFKMQANLAEVPMEWDPLHRFALMRDLDSEEKRLEAGRRYLALEPLFRDSPSRDNYANYLRQIVESPQVFAIKDKALVDPAGMVARMETLLKKYEGASPDTVDHWVRHALAYYLPTDAPQRLAFLRGHLKELWLDPLVMLINETQGKEIAQQVAAWMAGRDLNQVRAMYGHLMPLFNQYEQKELLQQAGSVYMMANPATFNRDHLFAYYFNSAHITVEAKLALIAEFYKRAGATRSLNALIDRMDNDKVWQESEAFNNLAAEIEKETPGSDPILVANAALYSMDGGDRGAAHKVVETLLAAYQGQIPGGSEHAKTMEEVALVNAIDRYLQICFHDRAAMERLGELTIGRIGLGSSSLAIVRRLREHGIYGPVHAAAVKLLPALPAAKVPNEDSWFYELSLARNADGNMTVVFPEAIWARVGSQNLLRYLMHNWSSWDGDRTAYNQLLMKVVTMPDFKPTDWALVRTAIDRLYNSASATAPVPPNVTHALWTVWLAHEQQDNAIDYYAEAQLYGQLVRSGHADAANAFLNQLLEVIGKRPAADQFGALAYVIQQVNFPMEEPGPLKPNHRLQFVLERLVPVGKQLAPGAGYFYFLPIPEQAVGTILAVLGEPEKWPADVVTKAQEAANLFERLVVEGANDWGHWPHFFRLADMQARRHAGAAEWDALADVLIWYATRMSVHGNWEYNYQYYILPLHTFLDEQGVHELGFAFVSAVIERNQLPDGVEKQVAILKAKSSQYMLGVVTVNKNDPTYALQLAAFEFAMGNEAKAWDLTYSKLKLLPEVWQSLDQLYIAWAIEQMRKQKMLDEALKFSFLVLLQENDLDPEVAATVSLTKGDIYRDMENYQAARIEYQALTSNNRYKLTRSGFKAQFRLIELLILTKNYATAEQHLERLVNLEDIRIQAEAYYLYARMMFDQQAYKESADYLKMVKDRVVNHVEAAFLQGELNLKLPGGLQHTEVPVGNPRLSTVAIPGRDLTLKLQDSNLAVAREKGAIPVIITTTRGDEERIRLQPSATNRNLFSGVIATSLGTVEKNNLRLELSGDDLVSYVIDPEFQKANDIAYPPKDLVVKADARLVASSGEILSEQEEEQREMQRRLMETRVNVRDQFYFRNPRTIRPGSPIYVQVRDFDRDTTAGPDTVTVKLQTYSGDVLEDFALTETEAHSGIFRGAVPTGIPFPKATVSDTREDRNPSVLINTGKTDTWSSLADGKKPKWVEVDTMSSHEVSQVYLEMPDTSQVRRASLLGMLSDDYQVLATYPEERRQGGQGVVVEYYSQGGFAAYFATRHTGILSIPKDGEYTLYLTSDDGSALWLDGQQQILNDGLHGMEEKTAKLQLTAGDHPLRIEFFQNDGGSGLTLHISGPDLPRQIVPAAMLAHDADGKRTEGLRGEYFRIPPGTAALPDLTALQPVITKVDPLLDFPSTTDVWKGLANDEMQLVASHAEPMVAFDWRRGRRELPAGMDGRMEVKIRGRLRPLFTEKYTLHVYSDDGIRLTVGGNVVIDQWRDSGHRELNAEIDLEAGKLVDILLETYDRNRDGQLYFAWSSPSQQKEWIPQDCLYPPSEGEPEEVLLPVEINMAYNQNGATPDQIATYLRVAPTVTWRQNRLSFERDRSPWPQQSWYTSQMRATFYVPENTTLELRFAQEPPPHAWQYCHLFVDGELLLGGYMDSNTINRSRRVPLVKGVHTIRVLNRDHWGSSAVKIQQRLDDGSYGDLPEAWFDPTLHPELAEALKPAAKLTVEPTRLSAALLAPKRLRRLRWVFEDFTGNEITVQRFGIVNAAGQTVVPAAEDFTSATTNRTLEIAPGDSITVTYQDEKRVREETPELTVDLNSQYHNGTIILANEEFYTDYNDRRMVEYQPAKRGRVGDQLTILIEEYDADLTDERDRLPVVVTTSSGETITLQALETMPNYGDEWHPHAGRFLAILRIGETTDQAKDTIGVKSGDVITVRYMDQENTKPGIPIEREYSMREGGSSKPEFVFYRTSVTMVEDTSPEALVKRERLRKQYRDAIIQRPQIVARHPQYRPKGQEAAPAAEGPVTVDVNAPLLLEVIYPKMARHAGSEMTVRVLPESEVKAAAREGRQPKATDMPCYIWGLDSLARVKGYPLLLQSHQRRERNDMLADGMFAGVLRLQVGSPGDPLDDLVVSGEKEFATQQQRQDDEDGFYYRVPTILVAGSDTLHLSILDEAGEVLVTQDVVLRSNARIELLERTYTVQNRAIYLGESLYVKITDPDRDTTDQQDNIEVALTAATGDRITATLSETLPHTGIFTGSIQPVFLGEADETGKVPAPKTDDDQLQVSFGDEVTIAYTDPLTLASDEPVVVEEKARIHYGSDAQLASFSKSFKDPEMAVKTRFLMAEALFEMAKQNRKLEQKALADENIAEGKAILEEAMRDYPDTSLASQGEFLLANLAEELGNYQEAIGRYSHVIRNWPEAEYAARSQFKMALCLEKMTNYDQACEEYVRLTYVYPDSPLVAEAIIRLANYYYSQEKYGVAGKIFYNFQQKNGSHELAPKALFLAAQCHIKDKSFEKAAEMLESLVGQYTEDKELRAEGMYWLGDSYYQMQDYAKAYQTFKKCTWDYPESKWAKYARGRLTDEQMIRVAEGEQ